MSFLAPQGPAAAAAAPPPPPIASTPNPALSTSQAQAAAAAASGKGFNKTVKTSPQGAPTPDTTTTRLIPAVAGTKNAFGT